MRRPFRRAVAQLSADRLRAAAALAVLLGAVAATPAPKPSAIDLTKIQPKSLLPKVPLHTEFVVDVNKLGQVTKIDSGKMSADHTYNVQTFGNAEQAFIRTPNGKAIPGSYRLTYDYDPKTARIKRDVALVKAGGVDANAPGLVKTMEEYVRTHQHSPSPAPAPSVRIERPATPKE